MSYMKKPDLDARQIATPVNAAPKNRQDQRVEVRQVRTLDERQMISVIRAAVWIGEEDGNYTDHFDDNDHCSSHLLVLVDGEPAGTVRCRWFGEFARLERLTIRKRFRSYKVLRALVMAAIRLAESKGYQIIIGQARTDVVPFWRRMGGETCGEARDTVYGALHPMMMRRPKHQQAASLDQVGRLEFESRIASWEGAAAA